MSDRDDRILAHVGLYQLTLRCVLEELFFDGANCGNVVQRLVAAKQLQIREGLPDRLSYYQLTRAEANRRGLPESRARALQNQALHTALAVLWFCSMSSVKRHRLEPQDVDQFFPETIPASIHCIERESDRHRLIRVKVVDPGSEDSSIIRSLRKAVFQTIERPGLRPWVTTGHYSFGIITETTARVERIRQIIADDEQLSASASFLVEQAPGVRTLKQAIHDRQPPAAQPKFRFASSEDESKSRQC